ncbi:CPS_collapsed_G0032750.mRNA.1.CDS.1 [Saccharomyces cerevisiae]|nr:CPS_collapsed_G0032750.mRNA.1.CDS.1 [Saccharomyces cerevisiae]
MDSICVVFYRHRIDNLYVVEEQTIGRYMSGSVTNRKGENYTYGDGSAISADRFGDHNLGDDDDADFENM